MTTTYDAARVRTELELDRERFEAMLQKGQPVGWICDQRTRDLWNLGHWLNEKFSGLSNEDRIQYNWYFNRKVRAEHDPFELAALVINKHILGEPIEEVYTVKYGTSVERSRR